VVAAMDIPNSLSQFDVNLIDDFDINEWLFWQGDGTKRERITAVFEESVDDSGRKVANKELDVLARWKANQGEYPILSHISIDLYAIPGMSAEVERVFSGFVLHFLSQIYVTSPV
jgi:hypothetical protein